MVKKQIEVEIKKAAIDCVTESPNASAEEITKYVMRETCGRASPTVVRKIIDSLFEGN